MKQRLIVPEFVVAAVAREREPRLFSIRRTPLLSGTIV